MNLRRIVVATVLGAFLVGWLVERARDRSLAFPVLPEPSPVDWERAPTPLGERSLTGRIVHDDGRPASEASVVWRGPVLSSFDDTDAGGRFELRHLPDEPVTLELLAWGAPPTTVRVEAGESDVTLTLRPPREDLEDLPEVRRDDLTGTVVPGGGRAGYEVLIQPADRAPDGFDPRLPRRATCDDEGRFTVPGLVHGAYHVELLPPWARGGAWPNLLPAGRRFVHPREGLTLLVQGGAIEGRASADGQPLVGALVVLNDAAHPERVWEPRTTDAEGRYRFDELPAGSYELELSAGQAVERRTELEVGNGDVLDVPFADVAVKEEG